MDHIPEPSGKRLPLFLLKKWQAQHLTAEDRSSTQSDERKSDQPSRQTKARASMFSNQVFAAEEIGDRLYKTSIVITDIQKQIERGEEIYYEETINHGNLFRGGWDTFADAKDPGSGETGFTRNTHQGSSRTVPNDSKWFSNSCIPEKRRIRPPPPVRAVPTTNSKIPKETNKNTLPPVQPNSASAEIPNAAADPNHETKKNKVLDSSNPQAQTEDTPMEEARFRKRKEPAVNESGTEPPQKKLNAATDVDLKQDNGRGQDSSDSADSDKVKKSALESVTNSTSSDEVACGVVPGGTDVGNKRNETKKDDMQIRRTTRTRRSSS